MKYGAKAKAPNVFKELCNTLTLLYDEFGPAGSPLKEVIDFAVLAASNANAGVRTAATGLLSEMYKHLGPALDQFMTDIKPATLKTI